MECAYRSSKSNMLLYFSEGFLIESSTYILLLSSMMTRRIQWKLRTYAMRANHNLK